MALNQALIAEMKHEAASTRKMLERVPTDKFDWAPHEKSMKLGKLATHVSNLPTWTGFTLNADELDLAGGVKQFTGTSTEALLKNHDDNIAEAIAVLENTSDEELMKPWTLKSGSHVIFTLPKIQIMRSVVFNHTYHHRGQLSVYLRSLDIPVPGMYGPSADD